MNKKLLEILACPICKGRLDYNKKRGALECHQDALAFPIRNGIPVLVAMDALPLEPDNKTPSRR
jgi:uncharacterized protein YbaR (Trm112 family)